MQTILNTFRRSDFNFKLRSEIYSIFDFIYFLCSPILLQQINERLAMFDDLKDRGRTLEGIELGPVDPLAPSGAAGSHDSGSGAKRVRGEEPRLKRPRSNRTGGPRSAEGIARASQNSLTHGAYATVIPESVEYLSYLDKAQQELRPSGLVEGELSASIAFSALKAQRLRDIELGRIARSARRGINTVELAKRVGFPWPGVHHELLAEPVNDTLLKRTVFDGWRRLAAPPPTLTPDEGVLSMPDHRVAAIYAEAYSFGRGWLDFNNRNSLS